MYSKNLGFARPIVCSDVEEPALEVPLLAVACFSKVNSLNASVESFEFEGNIKNFYCSLNSGSKIKFCVPNAVDTSNIIVGQNIDLSFDLNKTNILPVGPLAVD